MAKNIELMIKALEEVMSGEPWFGRSVNELLAEVDVKKSNKKPGGEGHSMLELIYHMNNWSLFTLRRLNGEKEPANAEDWPQIDTDKHNWKDGVRAFQTSHKKMISILKTKTDDFLDETVEYRDYNFRYLLNGLLTHHIYHIGQIVLLNKILA